MSDEATLAAQAVEYLGPYLQKAGAKAAGKLGGAAADGALKLLGFFKDKLKGEAPRAALADLEAAPEDADNQADLRKQLAKALAADTALCDELARLLAGLPAPAVDQDITITGDDNTAIQASGSHIKITTGGRDA